MKVTDAPVWWEFECKACKAHCQAEPEDVTGQPNVDYEGDVVGYIPVVECGRCGKEHNVPSEKITEKIRKIALEKGRQSRCHRFW